MKEEFRWYQSRRGAVHSRKESWFTSDEHEKIYKDNYKRIKGKKDLSPYVEPKVEVKPKPKPKAKKKTNKKK